MTTQILLEVPESRWVSAVLLIVTLGSTIGQTAKTLGLYKWAKIKTKVKYWNRLSRKSKKWERVWDESELLSSLIYYEFLLGYKFLKLLCNRLNLDLVDCCNLAWNEIKNRKGKTIDGTFIKN